MKTALIIDDDERCRTPVAQRLQSLGWEVVEAENGDRGLELAIKHAPAIILCNLLMPRGNGFALCRSVREQLDLRHTRIVAISDGEYWADREGALEAGADEVVTKESLLGELEKFVSRLESEMPPAATTNGAKPMLGDPGEGTRIRFWGVRGSIPTPGAETVRYGGNTPCVEVRADGEIIVLDAGSGIRALGLSLNKEFPGEPLSLTVLISHTHWDHIQGFPFFSPAYNPANRLRILGYEGARAGLGATLAGQMESPYFPIALKQMPGHIVIEELRELEFKVGAVAVEACFCKHPGVCVGYRLETGGGSVVYVPDNEWSYTDSIGDCKDECGTSAKMVEFIRGADVVIMDAQYDRGEYAEHQGWGHGCVDDVVRLALACAVKRLFLFHHDPAHDDDRIDELVRHARRIVRQHEGATLLVEAAREGVELFMAARSVSK